MSKSIQAAGLACLLLLTPGQAFADQNSWWGGEVQATQTPGKGNGFGYGLYETTLMASNGVGSITGVFPLCYADGNYAKCIDYNAQDAFHFEVDVIETTPLGNNPQNRDWMKECLKDDNCVLSHPNPPPRTNDGSLKAISFNTYPSDNQVYNYATFNLYNEYHDYSILVLPDKIMWRVDGKAVLSRTLNASIRTRQLNGNYARFDNLLRNGQVKFILNLWDGTQGNQGGFSGPPNTPVTAGNPAKFRRIAYYPATCTGSDCTVASKPSFLTDFKANSFVRDGKTVKVNNKSAICARSPGPDVFWETIRRDSFPVYVTPRNVECASDKGISMTMTRKEQ